MRALQALRRAGRHRALLFASVLLPLAQQASSLDFGLLFTRDRGLFTTRHCWCLQNIALKLVCVKPALSERPQRPQTKVGS